MPGYKERYRDIRDDDCKNKTEFAIFTPALQQARAATAKKAIELSFSVLSSFIFRLFRLGTAFITQLSVNGLNWLF